MHLVHRKHHHMRPFHFVTMFFRTWWYNFWGYAFLMWCLWRERNWRMFEDMESSDDQPLASFSGSLFDWSRAWGLTFSDSLPMFLSSLLCKLYLFFLFFIFFLCIFLNSALWLSAWGSVLEYTSLLLIKKKKRYAFLCVSTWWHCIWTSSFK